MSRCVRFPTESPKGDILHFQSRGMSKVSYNKESVEDHTSIVHVEAYSDLALITLIPQITRMSINIEPIAMERQNIRRVRGRSFKWIVRLLMWCRDGESKTFVTAYPNLDHVLQTRISPSISNQWSQKPAQKLRKKLIFQMCYQVLDLHLVSMLYQEGYARKLQRCTIYSRSEHCRHGEHHKLGPASAMVARETSNLEAAGSSPALGSSSKRSMSKPL